MDFAVWRARRALVDVLGLIGRYWLASLGWLLFALAISEPASATTWGNDACNSWVPGEIATCIAHPARTDCWMEAGDETATGQNYKIMFQYEPNYGGGIAQLTSWTCPKCSSASVVTAAEGGSDHFNWPSASHQECQGGCMYEPAPVGPGQDATVCGHVEIEFNGETQTGATNCLVEVLGPTGQACTPGADPPPPPSEVVPPEPECATASDGSTVCVEMQEICVMAGGEIICMQVQAMPTTQMAPSPPGDGLDVSAGSEPGPMPSDPTEPPKHSATATTTVDGVSQTFVVNWSPQGWNPDANGGNDLDDLRDPTGGQGEECQPGDTDCDGPNGGQCDPLTDICPDEEPGECDPQTGVCECDPVTQDCTAGAQGGVDCGDAPECQSDPVTCLVAFQTWHTRCEVMALKEGVIGEETRPAPEIEGNIWDQDSLSALPSVLSLNSSGGLGASCQPISVSVLSQSWSINFCDLLAIIGSLVMVAGYYVAGRILLGGQ